MSGRRLFPETPWLSLAAARCLREQGQSEAQLLLDRVMDLRQPLEADPAADCLDSGRTGRSLRAQDQRWKEAEEQYRLAIELCDDETIKRSWWFNLADIEQRLDDEGRRQVALRAAALPSGDEIAHRARHTGANIAPPDSRSNGN